MVLSWFSACGLIPFGCNIVNSYGFIQMFYAKLPQFFFSSHLSKSWYDYDLHDTAIFVYYPILNYDSSLFFSGVQKASETFHYII